MIITSIDRLPVVVTGPDGRPKKVFITPGSRDYPEISAKDPVAQPQLRIYRRSGRVGFDALLPDEIEVMRSTPGTVEDKTAAVMAARVPPVNPVARAKAQQAAKATAPKGADNAGGTRPTKAKSRKPRPVDSTDQSDRAIPAENTSGSCESGSIPE